MRRSSEPAFESFAVSARSATGRHDDAAAGRPVVLPIYWQDVPDLPGGDAAPVAPLGGWPDRGGSPRGLTVVCAAGGGLQAGPGWPPSLGPFEDFWRGVPADSLSRVDGAWTHAIASRVWPPSSRVRLTLRPSDAQILAECLRQRYAAGSAPRATSSDVEVIARHLARIDGTRDWGYLYLEARKGHSGGRLVETLSLAWRASWGTVGTAAYRIGQGDRNLVSDLAEHRFEVDGTPFRVRELPEWDRVTALRALRLPGAGSFRWVLSPLSRVAAVFDDGGPTRETDGPQDALT